MVEGRNQVFNLEKLDQKDPRLLNEVLERVIDAAPEDSPIRRRSEYLDCFTHKIINDITLSKGYLDFLRQARGRLPRGCVNYRERKGKRVRGSFLDEIYSLVAILNDELTKKKIAVGVGLEGIFEQLKKEGSRTPEKLAPRDIMELTVRRIKTIAKRNERKLERFFSEHPSKNKKRAGFRKKIIKGTRKLIERAEQTCQMIPD